MGAFEEQLLKTIQSLARVNPLRPEVIRKSLGTSGLATHGRKRAVKALLASIKNLRARAQYGKLRAALLVGVTWFGDDFLLHAERAGALLADKQTDENFGKYLEGLKSDTGEMREEGWRILHKRLGTYLAYQQLMSTMAELGSSASRVLARRPRRLVKMAFGAMALSFLRKHLEFVIPEQYSTLLDELGEPEEVASIASALVAAANEYHPLDSLDFAVPGPADLVVDELRELMIYGKSLVEQFEIGKYISLFRYDLEIVSEKRLVFCLRPPSPEFEYAMRLGFIRPLTNVGMASVDIAARGAANVLSMRTAAESFAKRFRAEIAEIRDKETDWRRLRLNFPSIPKLYEALKDSVFYEDLVSDEQLSRDFLIPLRYMSDTEVKLTQHLDLKTFHGAWRYLQFLGLVDTALLRDYAASDPLILMNSLVRVIGEESMRELFEGLELSKEQGQEFLEVISTDVRKRLGFLDLQYRPALRIAETWIPTEQRATEPEVVYVPALVITSNVSRNVQSANQFRIELNAKSFVEIAAETLRARFAKVETNKPVKGEYGATDIDIVIFEGGVLYLLECKHSLPPTGPHEMRDIWEEIEQGARQLETAVGILSDPARRQSYLTGWFPGTHQRDTIGLKVIGCVLCSHRIFSGLEYKGIPIRDFSSLARLCEGGIVGMGGSVAGDEVILRQYRIIQEETMSALDLADYCSPAPLFFKMFTPFMQPVSRLEQLGKITIAKETFVYEVELDEWSRHMESLGCKRAADRRQKLKPRTIQGNVVNNDGS